MRNCRAIIHNPKARDGAGFLERERGFPRWRTLRVHPPEVAADDGTDIFSLDLNDVPGKYP